MYSQLSHLNALAAAMNSGAARAALSIAINADLGKCLRFRCNLLTAIRARLGIFKIDLRLAADVSES